MSIPPFQVHVTPLKPFLSPALKTLPVLIQLTTGRQVAHRPPLTVGVALDCSGSMRGDRLAAAKQAVNMLMNELLDDDEIILTSYQSTARNQLARCPVGAARSVIPVLLERIGTGGQTALADGWELVASQLRTPASEGRLCRAIVLTDGEANMGETRTSALGRAAGQYAIAGINTTTIGLGQQFNADLLQAMADKGLGSSWYAESSQDLKECFDGEFGLLNNLEVRQASFGIVGIDNVVNRNEHPFNERSGRWILPGIPADAEAWALLEFPMGELVSTQSTGRPVTLHVTAIDAFNQEWTIAVDLPHYDTLSEPNWYATPENELVARRHQELETSRLQRAMRDALLSRDTPKARALLEQITLRAKGHPWLESVANELAIMLANGEAALEKELAYQSAKMRKRMALKNEMAGFDSNAESAMPAYMRRKLREGKSNI